MERQHRQKRYEIAMSRQINQLIGRRGRAVAILVAGFFLTTVLQAQTDPGPRGGAAGGGAAIAGLSGSESVFFTEGLKRFQEVEGVSQGLGPRFNSTSCSSCHLQPAVRGSSPAANQQG